MMKSIAAFLTLVGVLTATEANAQHFFRKGHARSAVTYASPAPSSVGTSYSSGYSGLAAWPMTSPTAPLYHYSYYASPPFQARTYQGYGSDDFPFQGVPYGHPYDLWTWPYMSGAYSRGLARYYDPPVK